MKPYVSNAARDSLSLDHHRSLAPKQEAILIEYLDVQVRHNGHFLILLNMNFLAFYLFGKFVCQMSSANFVPLAEI